MKRIVVAMSGGVDSSVAAAILKEQGHEVIGMTMQLWPREEKEGEKPACCGISEIESARKVAHSLGIVHYVVDFRDIFKKKVIEDFYTEYQKGRTPNPCIRCNQYIKFDVLLEKALGLGADLISTGHYARIEFNKASERYVLKKGLKEKNEQSYFLYTMTQAQLSKTLFPLGEMNKEEVRKYARKKELVNSEKKKSQEICFTGTKDYRDFLSKYINNTRPALSSEGAVIKPGPIVNKDGEILGRHKGLAFYTIGQREGLGISSKKPLYVVKIDTKTNKLVVGEEEALYNSDFEVIEPNYISIGELNSPIKAKVKIRYKHEAGEAEIRPINKDRCRVIFEKTQRAITPGQAAVFYQDDIVIGGGTIDKVN